MKLPPSSSSARDFMHGAATPAARPGSIATLPLRRLLARLLQSLACGSLTVQLPDGSRIHAGGSAPGPQAALHLHRWRPLARLLLRGDIGLAESYRDGDWSSSDLARLLEFGACNEAAWGKALAGSRLARGLGRLYRLSTSNTRRGSRRNISFHYDISNAFYGQWLDPRLIYSSALYQSPGQSLEAAQAAKLDRIVELLDLPPAASVLEIGCGWGALAIEIARRGARLTGLTLSSEQLAHARTQVAHEGLEQQVELRLQDYREVDGSYDRIVSIEMLEAVGERYWPLYFRTLRERLKPGGRGVLQVISIADEHFEHYREGTDFIQRYIFPGGMLPSPAVLQQQAEAAGLRLNCDLRFGSSYADTLADWRRRFDAARGNIGALGFDAAFQRLWEYYLCYCEAGFRSGKIDVGLYSFVHA